MYIMPDTMNHIMASRAFFSASLGSASSEATVDGGIDGADRGIGMVPGGGMGLAIGGAGAVAY